MIYKYSLLVVLLFITAPTLSAINPEAPPQTSQFASMLGEWQITDFQLQQDGTWQQGNGATWTWKTILDGYAIQDVWVAPISSQNSENKRYQHGTNIRVYNPKQEQWEMAWISNTGLQVDTFTATQIDDEIVMRGIFSGRDSRITLYEMKQSSFKWKLEFQMDEKWQEVYRIEGTK